jgi:4-hydroxy-3-methylbut-2-enyl diphosphate reductase
MNIIKITPQGFCKGVINSIRMVNELLENPNTKKPIYMLGSLVHNRHITKAFEEKGIIVLNHKSRLELLDEIDSGTVIFTAHGVSDLVRTKAQEKGLDIVDATCRDVSKSQLMIKNKIKEGYRILFYGQKNHPEAESALSISSHIFLVDDQTKLDELPDYQGKIILTTQTTMPYTNVLKIYQFLLEKHPQLELLEEICNATLKRQSAVIDQAGKLDLLIVVGDPLSNNTKMLKEVGEKQAHLKTIMIGSVEDLKGFDFSPYKNIGITAGASTPDAIVEEIIHKLSSQEKDFTTSLTSDDYLQKKR